MQIITVRGKKWSIGIDWEIMSDGTMAEAKKKAKEKNSKFGIFAEYESIRAVGLTKSKCSVPSAAYYLMLANQESLQNDPNNPTPDWIVVEEVEGEEDRYWLAVIREGLPAPQYDKIYDITQMREVIIDLSKSDSYLVYSPCREIIDLFEGIKDARELGLNELTENITEKPQSIKLKGIPDKYIYTGVALLSVLGVLWGVSTFIEGRSIQEKAQALKKRKEAQERQIQQQYEADKKKYHETLEALDKATKDTVLYGLGGSPKKIITSWFNEIANYRVGSHGWKLLNIQCYYNPKLPDISALTGKLPAEHNGIVLGCDYMYSRTGFATNRMLLQEYPSAQIAGNMALVSVPLNVPEKDLAPAPLKTLETLPAAKNWGFDMVSQLQLLKMVGIEHTIGHSSDIVYVAPAKPLTPDQVKKGEKPAKNGGTLSTGYAKGDLVLKSKNLELLKEVADNVEFNAVGVKSVDLKVGTFAIVSWDLKTQYYVNSKSGGVVGADSASVIGSPTGQEQPGGVAPAPTPSPAQ